MPDFAKLSEIDHISNIGKIFEIIEKSRGLSGHSGASDAAIPLHISADATLEIQSLALQGTRASMLADGIQFKTMDEVNKETVSHLVKSMGDAFFNPVTGIGTSIDPGYWNNAYTPISMSPQEVTSYYSSGGIPRIITDKKSEGILVNGYQFVGEEWNKQDLETLKKYADELGFDLALTPSVRDGNAYGGSLLVPQFYEDDALTMQMGFMEMGKAGLLKKGSLERLWSADRWNAIMVPDYNISARDYLHPREIFVPITGYTVNTSRSALIRPKDLPYWGALRQMGWGISDMEGWIRSVLAYEVCIASIPIMAQQLSLLFRIIPMDGVVAQNGPEYAQELAEKTSLALTRASNVLPQTINSAGDVKVVERHFTDFDKLVQVLRQDVGAQSEIPDSLLFNTQATGFSDNKEDITLKEAGSIKKIGNKVKAQIGPIVEAMVYGCFGWGSEQALKAKKVRVSFDSPTVLTNEERNQAGTTFSVVLGAGIQAGMQPGDAIEIAKAFIPDIELPQEIIDKMKSAPDEMAESIFGNNPEEIEDLGARLRGESTEALQDFGERVKGRPILDRVSNEAAIVQKSGNWFTRIGNFVRRQHPTGDAEFREQDHRRPRTG